MPGCSPHGQHITPMFLSLGRAVWLRTWADKLVTGKEFNVLSSFWPAGNNLMERRMGDLICECHNICNSLKLQGEKCLEVWRKIVSLQNDMLDSPALCVLGNTTGFAAWRGVS